MGISGIKGKGLPNTFTSQEIAQFFMEYGKIQTFPKNTTLYTCGESSNQVYFINHGEVRISRSTNEGKEITLDILGPNETFGEAATIQGVERKNTATAKKDTIVHSVGRELMLDKMKSDPRLAFWLLDLVSKKQLHKENLLENLLFKSANAKVAGLLLDLATNYGVQEDDGLLIDYPITHQEIGNIIATTRETVSYAFMEFRQLGLIDTIKRRTLIIDKEGLNDIAAEL